MICITILYFVLTGKFTGDDNFPLQFDDESPRFCIPNVTNNVRHVERNVQNVFVADLEVGANVIVNSALKKTIQPCVSNNLIGNASTFNGSENNKEASTKESQRHLEHHSYTLQGINTSDTMYEMKKNMDEAISSNLELLIENKNLKEALNNLKQELTSLQKKIGISEAKLKIEQLKPRPNLGFRLEFICHDDTKVRFYTGFENKCRLQIFLSFIIEGYNLSKQNNKSRRPTGRPRALDTENEIFVVLCRLRLGLVAYDLAYRFQVSESTINNIWHFWLNFLSLYLVQVPIWPSRLTVNKFMPEAFRNEYPSTRVILDCTKLFIENPTEFRVQSDTYSSYKSHNTAKGLIGITPNGFVSLVSDLSPF